MEILSFDIMVGDILLLEKGDMIPADGIVTESFALLVDESSMTGESGIFYYYTHYYNNEVFNLLLSSLFSLLLLI